MARCRQTWKDWPGTTKAERDEAGPTRQGRHQIANALEKIPERFSSKQWLGKNLGKQVKLRPPAGEAG